MLGPTTEKNAQLTSAEMKLWRRCLRLCEIGRGMETETIEAKKKGIV
jgi:hypothetical protein